MSASYAVTVRFAPNNEIRISTGVEYQKKKKSESMACKPLDLYWSEGRRVGTDDRFFQLSIFSDAVSFAEDSRPFACDLSELKDNARWVPSMRRWVWRPEKLAQKLSQGLSVWSEDRNFVHRPYPEICSDRFVAGHTFFDDEVSDASAPDRFGPPGPMSGGREAPLAISSETQGTFKPGWGLPCRATKYTPLARRRLLSAGAIMEKWGYGPGNSALLTLTLPGSIPEAIEAVGNWSGLIRQNLLQWLRDKGISIYLYKWEWQQRGALHAHIAIAHDDVKKVQGICDSWKAYCTKLWDFVSLKSGVDMWAKNKGFSHKLNKGVLNADASIVRKSVAAYVSKYVSKPVGALTSKAKKTLVYPTQWWGISSNLRKAVAKESFTFVYRDSIENCHNFARELHQFFGEVAKAIYTYFHKITDEPTSVYYWESDIFQQIDWSKWGQETFAAWRQRNGLVCDFRIEARAGWHVRCVGKSYQPYYVLSLSEVVMGQNPEMPVWSDSRVV